MSKIIEFIDDVCDAFELGPEICKLSIKHYKLYTQKKGVELKADIVFLVLTIIRTCSKLHDGIKLDIRELCDIAAKNGKFVERNDFNRNELIFLNTIDWNISWMNSF